MRKQRTSCSLCLVLLVLLLAHCGHADEYEVYLLAGQSNMDGRGPASDLTPDQLQPFDNAIMFYRNSLTSSNGWKPLAPGFSMPPGYKGDLPSPTFGPEIGFARAMLKIRPGRKLALIKGSKGGTSLARDWNPGEPGNPESQGGRYLDFVETIQLATSALKESGDSYQIRGLLWHQGESDAKSTEEVYRARLIEFVQRIRQDTGSPNLPIVLGDLFDNGKRDGVRAALQTVGTSGTGFGFVTSAGTATWDEGTHFDATSQLLLGERYAESMIEVQKSSSQTNATVVCFGDSITKRGYPSLVAKQLNVDVINAGVAGNTTSKALRRMETDVIKHKPGVVVIFFGTNDSRVDNATVYVPVSKYRENLLTMIEACKAIHSKIVLCTLPPIDPEPYFTRHDKEAFDRVGGLAPLLVQYQVAAREVAMANGVKLVDLYSLLPQNPEWMSPDGVHPSKAGNAIIAKHIADAISDLVD